MAPAASAPPASITAVGRPRLLLCAPRTTSSWEARLPVAPVLSIEKAVNHPHFRQRRTVRRVSDRVFGELDIPGMPLRFSEFPEELPLEAPFLGEHNEEILCQYLGYSPEEVRALEKHGVLKRDPLPG